MNHSTRLFRLIALFAATTAIASAYAATKSDLAKEKRWEEQIVPSMLVGDDVHISADGVSFLGLYTEPDTEDAKGAVILIHGRGAHPAWPEVIEPLRVHLSELGWHTLSLQMPVLGNEATDVDYAPLFSEVPGRIQAGVDFLKDKGIDNIVLAGHSFGAAMASYYVASRHDPAVKTFAILSGGPGHEGDPSADMFNNFRQVDGVIVLDVFGSEDRKPIFEAVDKRRAFAGTQDMSSYQAFPIQGADHFYRGKEQELANTLNGRLAGIR